MSLFEYYIIGGILLIMSASNILSASQGSKPFGGIDDYNVVWTSQSKNSSESMPVGGGDIGLNLWVENDEVMFYLSQSGTFDENNSFLKHGRVRMKFSPNPFSQNAKFTQELKLKDGYVEIKSNSDSQKFKIDVWVDVFSSVVHVDVDSSKPIEVKAIYEGWRTEDQEVPLKYRHQCFSYSGYPGKIETYKDSVSFVGNNVRWRHRNRDDKLLFDFIVKQQGLEAVKAEMINTQKGRTFGGLMLGDGMVNAGQTSGRYVDTDFTGWVLKTKKPQKKTKLKVCLHVDQTNSIEQWQKGLDDLAALAVSRENVARKESRKWWNDFFNRSHIAIRHKNNDPDDPVWQIGKNYQLFRYMLGCNAYGKYPSKFNGSLFTFDPRFVSAEKKATPDFRNWGGGSFTAQNQRLLYWLMLKSGDFDVMLCQFEFYRRVLRNAELRTKVYWGHQGCSFTEQLENFGLPFAGGWGFYASDNKARLRTDADEFGVQFNRHIKYQYNHQLEFSLMILDYYAFSGKDISKYIPFIESSLTFYDQHYRYRNRKRSGKDYDQNGKLVIYPSTALETYKNVKNPTDVCAALKVVTQRFIELPGRYVPTEKKTRWKEFLTHIPDITFGTTKDGHKIILPAREIPKSINHEHPEMYVVYPYGLYGCGKPDLQTAKNTWKYMSPIRKKGVGGWRQNGIFLARMGLTDEAKHVAIFKLKDSVYRFPVFWGPNYDWVPDGDHGSSGIIGLQEMLMQTDGDKILLLPAWPKDWDVDFKLWAPYRTIVCGKVVNGKLESLEVSPSHRKKDVIVMWR